MKLSKILFSAILLFLSVSCFADDTPIPADKLPTAVKSFVQKQFPKQKILFAEEDSGFFETTKYEIRLDDGTSVEVLKSGEWKKLENKTKGISSSLIPSGIADYIKANYAGALTLKIEKEKYGYEVKLSSGLELKFNQQLQLIGMDD